MRDLYPSWGSGPRGGNLCPATFLNSVTVSITAILLSQVPRTLEVASWDTLRDLNSQTGNWFIDNCGVVVQEPLIRL